MDIVHLYRDDPIPDLAPYSHLMVMGGPMDVWEVEANPWIPAEIDAIARWVQTGHPYLGICLGHQLLAEATGGACAAMQTPEIGVTPIQRTDAAKDPLLGALPRRFNEPLRGPCGAMVKRPVAIKRQPSAQNL
ncbi:glutamine amidotransferase-related protein [Thalassobacter stenotrophicus]|uniref:glutamine amidotransferase-related protein n=1 Tax=Thalassobacter stenotrophicus TaxID=266809 RepID=UPI00068BCE34|nr:hypothetical protein [Thalassobacter stenotrophicus]